MTNNLEELKKAVHKKGFNISMMINTFKKRQRALKSTREIPDAVLCEVCLEYLKRGDHIRKEFPYFMRILNSKMDEFQANKVQAEHKEKKFGAMPSNMKSILKNM